MKFFNDQINVLKQALIRLIYTIEQWLTYFTMKYLPLSNLFFFAHFLSEANVWTPFCNTPSETLRGDIFVSPQTTFPLPGTHCNTKFDPTNIFSFPATNLVSPVPNDHWFERQSGVNSHRLNLQNR